MRGGDDLARQERVVEQFALNRSGMSVEIYRETDTSGGVELAKRELGARLLADARKGDEVYVESLDRLFLDGRDAVTTILQFRDRGIALWVCDLQINVADPKVASLMGKVFAAGYRAADELSRLRIVAGQAEAKRKGRKPGRARVLSDADIKKVQERRKRRQSLRQIANKLKVSHSTVRRMLMRPLE